MSPTNVSRLARTAVTAVLGAAVLATVGTQGAVAVTSPPTPPADSPVPSAAPTADSPSTNISTPVIHSASTAIGGPLLSTRGIVEDPAAGLMPSFDGVSYVVADATTGQILAAKDPHGAARPASTQKTLLALTMLPRLDPDSTYTAAPSDVNVEGTRVGLAAGETYQINDIWYALLLKSANDAAMALAHAGADGDMAKAIAMEQAEAVNLQALDTHVVNPSGLDAPGQFSSAYDLALFGRAMLQRGDARKYMGTAHWRFPGNTTATKQAVDPAEIQVNTINRLLGHYPGIVGVKPGYTTLARNTDIVAATHGDTTILVTLMGVPGPTVTREAAAFLDWGFAHDGRVNPVGTLVNPLSAGDVLSSNDAFASSTTHELHAKRPSRARLSAATLAWPAVSGGAAVVLGGAAALRLGLGRRRSRRRTPAA